MAYLDDTTILNQDQLWRRINPKWIVPDENTGGVRISSAAFCDSPDKSPMSVTLGTEYLRNGGTIDALKVRYPGYHLASLTAGQVRDKKQIVTRDSTEEDKCHAVVFGKKTASVKNAFVEMAIWIISP